MKYVIVLSDGMAGRPLEVLGGRTTMEAAYTPVMYGVHGAGRDGTRERYGQSCGYGL